MRKQTSKKAYNNEALSTEYESPQAREPATVLYPREVIGSNPLYTGASSVSCRGLSDSKDREAPRFYSIPLYAREEIPIHD